MSENLTGGQLQEVMDTLLYEALAPVIMYTKIFDTQLIYLLALGAKNKKRKISSLDRDKLNDLLSRAIQAEDPEQKLYYIKKLHLERSFVSVFLNRFIDKYKPFLSIYALYMNDAKNRTVYRDKLLPYIDSCGSLSRSDLFLAITKCAYALEKYKTYFGKVVGQFYKLCFIYAKNLIDTNPNNYDMNDVIQNLNRKVVVALNKYDSNSGALTSYIKWWLYNSITCSSSEHEYGIAYTIPQNHKTRDTVNFSISLDAKLNSDEGDMALADVIASDDIELSEGVVSSDIIKRIGLVVKSADPFGIARLTLDIPEVFTDSELRKMQSITQSL
jgi:hypothetical protein